MKHENGGVRTKSVFYHEFTPSRRPYKTVENKSFICISKFKTNGKMRPSCHFFIFLFFYFVLLKKEEHSFPPGIMKDKDNLIHIAIK